MARGAISTTGAPGRGPHRQQLDLDAALPAIGAGPRHVGQVEQPLRHRLRCPRSTTPPAARTRLVGDGEDAMLLLPADQAVRLHLQPGRTQREGRVARHRTAPAAPGRRPARARARPSGSRQSIAKPSAPGVALELALPPGPTAPMPERAHPCRVDRQAGSHRVPAEAQQQILARGDRRRNVDPLDRPGRPAARSAGLRSISSTTGPAVPLDQPAGDNPDDARGPIRAGEDERRRDRAATGPRRSCASASCVTRSVRNLRRGVQRFQVRRDDAGGRPVRGRQQLDARARVGQPARRVEPGRQRERDVLLRQVRRVELGGLKERLDARSARVCAGLPARAAPGAGCRRAAAPGPR